MLTKTYDHWGRHLAVEMWSFGKYVLLTKKLSLIVWNTRSDKMRVSDLVVPVVELKGILSLFESYRVTTPKVFGIPITHYTCKPTFSPALWNWIVIYLKTWWWDSKRGSGPQRVLTSQAHSSRSCCWCRRAAKQRSSGRRGWKEKVSSDCTTGHTVVTHRLGRCFADTDTHFSNFN